MEIFDALFPFLIMLIYFLASARKRAAKKGQQEATGETGAKKPSAFEELLRQIQEAAEQAQNPQPETVSVTEEDDVYELEQNFHDQSGFDHDEHGFGKSNPFSEEVFEQAPRDPAPPAHADGHLDYNPHGTPGSVIDSKPVRSRRRMHPAAASLLGASGLKEAFVLKQILDEPLSKRR